MLSKTISDPGSNRVAVDTHDPLSGTGQKQRDAAPFESLNDGRYRDGPTERGGGQLGSSTPFSIFEDRRREPMTQDTPPLRRGGPAREETGPGYQREGDPSIRERMTRDQFEHDHSRRSTLSAGHGTHLLEPPYREGSARMEDERHRERMAQTGLPFRPGRDEEEQFPRHHSGPDAPEWNRHDILPSLRRDALQRNEMPGFVPNERPADGMFQEMHQHGRPEFVHRNGLPPRDFPPMGNDRRVPGPELVVASDRPGNLASSRPVRSPLPHGGRLPEELSDGPGRFFGHEEQFQRPPPPNNRVGLPAAGAYLEPRGLPSNERSLDHPQGGRPDEQRRQGGHADEGGRERFDSLGRTSFEGARHPEDNRQLISQEYREHEPQILNSSFDGRSGRPMWTPDAQDPFGRGRGGRGQTRDLGGRGGRDILNLARPLVPADRVSSQRETERCNDQPVRMLGRADFRDAPGRGTRAAPPLRSLPSAESRQNPARSHSSPLPSRPSSITAGQVKSLSDAADTTQTRKSEMDTASDTASPAVRTPSELVPDAPKDKNREGLAGDSNSSEPKVSTPSPASVRKRVQTPPPREPSSYVVSLTRLADLEAQLDYTYAKHMRLVQQGQILRSRSNLLESLPVGIEAFQDELDAFVEKLRISTTTNALEAGS
jgi:hypothetical protein